MAVGVMMGSQAGHSGIGDYMGPALLFEETCSYTAPFSFAQYENYCLTAPALRCPERVFHFTAFLRFAILALAVDYSPSCHL